MHPESSQNHYAKKKIYIDFENSNFFSSVAPLTDRVKQWINGK